MVSIHGICESQMVAQVLFSLPTFLLFFFFFEARSLCTSCCSVTCYITWTQRELPASDSWVLGLKSGDTMASFKLVICKRTQSRSIITQYWMVTRSFGWEFKLKIIFYSLSFHLEIPEQAFIKIALSKRRWFDWETPGRLGMQTWGLPRRVFTRTVRYDSSDLKNGQPLHGFTVSWETVEDRMWVAGNLSLD